MSGLNELVRLAVLQWFPSSNSTVGMLAAAAVSHIAVRNMRAARRRIFRPIHLLGRAVRGVACYAVVIGAAWLVLTMGLHHP
ncbi:MAG: hypothetical protein PHQ28_00725 [Mycobacterium sp.]|nr:hypothetical protein [Mycobacterium sp.]